MDKIDRSAFQYELPDERIAKHPLAERDQSRLLVYRHGEIAHSHFNRLREFLPASTHLVFNDTKVIPARVLFEKDSGAAIEIFLMSPADPLELVVTAMRATGLARWRCLIGNLKRWPEGVVLTKTAAGATLNANLVHREKGIVEFNWTPSGQTLAEVLAWAGATPLPPYLHRQASPEDRERYQTVYSASAGAVAAPTAGLHFTDRLIKELADNGVTSDFLTLHVSAGTFQPIKTENAVDHPMHTEQLLVSAETVARLVAPEKSIIAVGTTSLRTLESIYWYGIKLLHNPEAAFRIDKLDPYQLPAAPVREALDAVGAYVARKKLQVLHGETSIYILPGYEFHICDALITNFHQPGSTLMLLVAAFVGEDWKRIYREALARQYRFLSYGDSSLLIPTNVRRS